MTTNNEVKAPRPCTLPKEWVGTGLIDSNNGYIKAFKPISDSLEAWDAVKGVE